MTFPSIYDPAMRTMIAFGGKYPTTVIPSTIVLDRSTGSPRCSCAKLLAEDLLPVVQRLAAEAGVAVSGFTETATAGPLLLALAVWVLAGLVSFASPCVVPLVPGYLSYLAAVVGVDDGGSPRRPSDARLAGGRRRRRCSSPASPWCSCSARSRCWA